MLVFPVVSPRSASRLRNIFAVIFKEIEGRRHIERLLATLETDVATRRWPKIGSFPNKVSKKTRSSSMAHIVSLIEISQSWQ